MFQYDLNDCCMTRLIMLQHGWDFCCMAGQLYKRAWLDKTNGTTRQLIKEHDWDKHEHI